MYLGMRSPVARNAHNACATTPNTFIVGSFLRPLSFDTSILRVPRTVAHTQRSHFAHTVATRVRRYSAAPRRHASFGRLQNSGSGRQGRWASRIDSGE
jgi:hypothetical protein